MASYTYTSSDLAVATQFANRRQHDSSHYAKRGNVPEKVWADCVNGALAEIAAYKALSALFDNATVDQPDFEYYAQRDKNWDPDLKVRFQKLDEEEEVAVKTHVKSFLAGRFGNRIKESFMFQKNSGMHADRDIAQIQINGNALDLFVPVVNRVQAYEDHLIPKVDTTGIADCCTVYGPFSMQDIVTQKMWKPPKIERLRKTKQVVYLHEIFKKLSCVESIEIH